MKDILCIRGGQAWPKIVDNWDRYDSILTVSEDNRVIFECPYFNTDHSINYKGGILSEGVYGWICFNSKKLGKSLCLFQARYFDKINSADDLDESRLILPSLVPNPNHQNNMVITDILIHNGRRTRDGSAGCQTLYPDYYEEFISLFQINEKGYYTLEREKNWIAPEFYQGN